MQQIIGNTAQELQDTISNNIEHKPRKTRDISIPLGGMPQEIYKRKEYCSDSMLYLIVPKHKVAIPYGNAITPKLLETLADILVTRGDIQSSQTITDYPIVTHVQLDIHYSDYEQVEQLKIIPVYKPRKALSGWEDRRKKETRRSYLNTVKVMKAKELDRQDPFIGGENIGTVSPNNYKISPDRLREIAREGK